MNVDLPDLSPIEIFDLGAIIGKVDAFNPYAYVTSQVGGSSESSASNLLTDADRIKTLKKDANKLIGGDHWYCQQLSAIHKKMRNAVKGAVEERPANLSSAESTRSKLYAATSEDPVFCLGRMIGHIVPGFCARHPFHEGDWVTYACFMKSIKSIGDDDKYGSAIRDLLLENTKWVKKEWAAWAKEKKEREKKARKRGDWEWRCETLQDDRLLDCIRKALAGVVREGSCPEGAPVATLGQAQVPVTPSQDAEKAGDPPPSPDAPKPEFKVSVLSFPATGKNPKRDRVEKLTCNGIKIHSTPQCVLRFLAINFASQGDGSFLFSSADVKMTRDGENVVDLPAAGVFCIKCGKGRSEVATGLATQVDRIIYRMLTGKREPEDKQGKKEMKEILNRVGRDERRTNIEGMLPVKLRNVQVSVSAKAKANIREYCKKMTKVPEPEIDVILGACADC